MTDFEIRDMWFENMMSIVMSDRNHTIDDVADVVHRTCDSSIEYIKQDLLDNEWATEEELNGHQ